MSKNTESDTKRPALLLAGRTATEVVGFVLGVLTAHYQRKAENAQAQLKALKGLNCKELEAFWVELRKSASAEDALHIFTNWIEGKLDGDGLSFGKASDGH